MIFREKGTLRKHLEIPLRKWNLILDIVHAPHALFYQLSSSYFKMLHHRFCLTILHYINNTVPKFRHIDCCRWDYDNSNQLFISIAVSVFTTVLYNDVATGVFFQKWSNCVAPYTTPLCHFKDTSSWVVQSWGQIRM